jgi:1-aminocyclopropane-1-carboxylate deaminase/D-cysteine desulfhydrase-like pyridoxal-dependent ACC family enzyme
MFMSRARVVGISVSRTSERIRTATAALVKEAAGILHLKEFPARQAVEAYDTYHGEYGAFTDSAKDAIITCARLEGLLLDPVYTGKAMAGLIDLARKGVLDRNIPTIFLHTGGLPIIFAYEKQFRSLASCTKI